MDNNKVVDLLTLVEQASQSGKPPSPPTLEVGLRDFSQAELESLLDNYSSTAIQSMAVGRNVTGHKKSALVQALVRVVYEPNSIKSALAKLSQVAQYGLARLKVNGGVMDRTSWQVQLTNRFGKNAGEQAERELIGRALAFYALRNAEYLQFISYSKHDIGRPGFYERQSTICVPSRVLDQFMPGKSVVELVAPPAPKPYLNSEPELVAPANYDALLADIFTFLRYLEQNKARILKSGDLGKRDFVKLYDQMQVKEATGPANLTKLSETGRVNFLWNILLALRLVGGEPDENAYTRPEMVQRFYALPRYMQVKALTLAWTASQFNDFLRIPTLNFLTTSANVSDIPTTERLAVARNLVMSVMQEFFEAGQLKGSQGGGWVSLESLFTTIREINLEILVSRGVRPMTYYGYGNGYFGDEYYNGFTSKLKTSEKKKKSYYIPDNALKLNEDWNLVEGEWLVQLFRESFNWLGLAELAVQPGTKQSVAFRLTDLGRSMFLGKPSEQEEAAARQAAELASKAPELARSLIVQPNFDVMVLAPLQNMPLLQQIDRFANQTSLGDVAMYRINKESVMRGLRAGLSGSAILAILENNSRVPVAQNIVTSINDWNAEFERLVLRPRTHLLEVPDPAMLDSLLADPNTASRIEKRLGPTFALIKGKPDSLDKALSKGQSKPLYLDYAKVYPNSIFPIGSRRLQVKEFFGNAYVYYRLGQFADLVEENREKLSATFELSEAAGKRAQSLGFTYDLVQAFLNAWRGQNKPLPGEMTLMLKNWLGYYAPLKGERAVTLTASVRNQLDDIFSLPEFAPLLIERASPKVAIVREELLEQLRPTLAEMGVKFDAPGLPGFSEAAAEEAEQSGLKGRRIESEADKERRRRETQEQIGRGSNVVYLSSRPLGGEIIPADDFGNVNSQFSGPSEEDLMELLRLMQNAQLLDDIDFDDDEPPPPFGRRRRRR